MSTAEKTKKPRKTKETKAKPGPKSGELAVTVECPYCGGKAHRKAIQTIKGVGTFRRHYCVEGCGHYHYRDIETNEVKEVGNGPRECKWHNGSANDEIKRLKAELIRANKANANRSDGIGELAATLGISVDELAFTSIVEGKPRAIVLAFSEADLAAFPTQEERETAERLNKALLTVQACIKAYKAKGKK